MKVQYTLTESILQREQTLIKQLESLRLLFGISLEYESDVTAVGSRDAVVAQRRHHGNRG